MKYRSWIWVLLTFMAISLCLRIIPSCSSVFTNLGVKFATNDAYYHMRLIDNLVYNFPRFSFYDPYFIFPGTTVIGGAHFFDWLVASVIWVVGLGSPTQATIDIVGVHLPPILAALIVVPVYFIGKAVFNKWAGVTAALLVAILPGEFLGRSILGATDHHVAEVLFSTTAIMFLVLAIKSVSTKRTRMFTILAGVFLGVYLLTWLGGLFFILIICLFLVVQIISNHLRGVSSTRLASITTAIIAIATLMNISSTLPKEVLLLLLLSIALPAVLATSSWFMLKHHWHPAVFPSVITVVGIAFLAGVDWLYPAFTGYLGMFLPSGSTATTTMELQPMLFPHGQLTLALLWSNFTIITILAPIGLAFMSWRGDVRLLLIVWSVVMIALMLNQRRYAYYAVVNMALLSGYLVYLATQYITWVQVRHKGKMITRLSLTRLWITLLMVAFILIPVNLSASIQTAKTATFAPPNSWQSALLWMRGNTSEPFEDDIYDAYLPLLAKDLPEGVLSNPTYLDYLTGKHHLASPVPDYSVTAWWDYGYWITRTARRVPNANPAQNADAVKRVASLLLSTGDDYQEQAKELKSRYIVLDNATALSKFYAIASWGGRDSKEYFDTYRAPDGDGVYKDIVLFHIEYYKTLVSRLYNFNGDAVAPERTVVITHKDNVVLEARQFTDYWKAKGYVDNTPGTRIVGAYPTVSPIPLERVDYELVYGSEEIVNGLATVKVYEYRRSMSQP